MKKALLFVLAILVAPTPVAPQSNVAMESGVEFELYDLCWKTYSEILERVTTFCGGGGSNRSQQGWVANQLNIWLRNHTGRPITALRFVLQLADPFGDEIWSDQLTFGTGTISDRDPNGGPPGFASAFFDIDEGWGNILAQYDTWDIRVTVTDVQVVH